MENLARSKDRTNEFLATRAIKDANEVTISIFSLRNMQILNIKHDIGANQIDDIISKFMATRKQLVANAKQLRNGL